MGKTLKACAIAMLASLTISRNVYADPQNTVVDLQPSDVMNGIVLESGGVDDHLTCSVDGSEQISTSIGVNYFRWNVLGSSAKGQHILNCKVTDDQGGTCFAYHLRLVNGFKVIKTMEDQCCSDSCKRPNPVLDENFTINLP